MNPFSRRIAGLVSNFLPPLCNWIGLEGIKIPDGLFNNWTAYGVGIALLLLALYSLGRGLWSLYLTHQLKHRYPQLRGEEFPSLFYLLKSLRRKMGLKREVQLYSAPHRNPLIFTAGWLKPAVFISLQLIESLTAEEVAVMLAHELAHIRRWDNMSLWLGSLAKNFLVFVPLRDLLWRSFLQRREEACDDLAAFATGKPLILAETLVKVCRMASELHSPAHSKSYQLSYGVELESLERRVMRLISPPTRKPRVKKAPFVILTIASISLISLFVWAMGGSYYCLL